MEEHDAGRQGEGITISGPLDLREVTLRKVDVAVDQLDWAMRLVMDHGAFVPAITLAGAAEEILGKRSGAPVLNEIAGTLAQEHGVSAKWIIDAHMNSMKNWLKHDGSGNGDSVECDVRQEAVAMIHRALINLHSYDGSAPSQWPRYRAWVEANMAQYLGDVSKA